jgi:hypothetical protein
MLLTDNDKLVAHRLIQWERNRVAQYESQGYDCSLQRIRGDIAEAAIDADTDTWTMDTRFFFMALLEVLRAGAKARAAGFEGPETYPVPSLNQQQIAACKQFAADIGVLNRLREVAPVAWDPNLP